MLYFAFCCTILFLVAHREVSECEPQYATVYLTIFVPCRRHPNAFEAAAGVSSVVRNSSVPVTIGEVLYRDLSTGLDYDISTAWVAGTCATILYTTNAEYLASACRQLGLTYSSSNSICAGNEYACSREAVRI